MPHTDLTALRRVGAVAAWVIAIAATALMVVRITTGSASNECVAPDSATVALLQQPHVPEAQRINYQAFTVYYDNKAHLPRCVTYELTSDELVGGEARTDAFAADSTVAGCAPPDAFAGTGMHRGHMAPAADIHWSTTAMRQSFLMTNICPQHRSLNEGGWARLEAKCREWVMRDKALIIACGPVLDDGLDTIADSGVPVPKRYYKVVLAHCTRPMRALAFVYPNGPANGPLSRYVTTVDEVERLTGIDFFATLPPDEQERLEAHSNLPQWLY